MVAGSASMAIASMWASMTAWFTPTLLFCATNLIIATIFISSNNKKKNNHHQDQHTNLLSRISRVSSFFHRSTSINSSSSNSTTTTVESQHQYPPEPKTPTYSSTSRLAQSIHLSSDDYEDRQPQSQPGNSPGQVVRAAPSLIDRVKSFRIATAFDFGEPKTVDTDPSHNPDPEHYVIRSCKSEKSSVKMKKSSVEMKKSRSEIRIGGREEEDVNLRRPETARERRRADVDGRVDARADDFISRFRQQLKLQRVESLVRFKEMLNRGR